MSFANGQAIIRRAGSYTHDVIGQSDVTGLVAALAAKATPADVAAAIAALVNSAPGLLDTLGEIAAQLSTDETAVGALTSAVALKAPLASPSLTGTPTAPTVAGSTDNTTKLATTAFVQAVVAGIVAGVSSFNSRTGAVVPASGDYATADITGLVAALALKAALASPALTGTPTAPTVAGTTDSTTALATTAFVQAVAALLAPLASPALTGTPTAPTASASDNSTKLATTAYVDTADALKAPLASPTLTGTPAAPTVAGTTDSTTKIATTAFVQGVAALLATLASPAFTGNPTAPTATVGDNDTSIATTAFVQAAIAAVSAGVTSFNTRSGAVVPVSGDYATADITGLVATLALKAALASPALTGTPTAPTASAADNSTKIATTAYADAIAALKANIVSPTFTGTPAAPTPALGTSTTQVATAAFVQAAMGGNLDLAWTMDPRNYHTPVGVPDGVNRAVYVRVTRGGTVQKLGIFVGTASGNISVGIYNNSGAGTSARPGTLVVSSGAIACPAAGFQEITLSGGPYVVQPGDWFAISADNNTATFYRVLGAAINKFPFLNGKQASAHPLPSPAGTLVAEDRPYIIVGIP